MDCPCYSKRLYENCCKPYHKGAHAPNALYLMRSRFSAYALKLADYIINTTHPDQLLERESWLHQIKHFSQQTSFQNLEILEYIPGLHHATVQFKATLFQNKKDVSFIETSQFEIMNGIWFYKSGTISHIY